MVGHAQSRAFLSFLASAGTAYATTQGGCSLSSTTCGAEGPAPLSAASTGGLPLAPVAGGRNDYTFEEGNAIIIEDIKQGKVVNGYQVTDSNEAPFYARILSCASGNGGCSICGSSWITGNTLLTAAHCVDANEDGTNPNHNVYVYPWRDGGVVGGGSYTHSVPTGRVTVHADWFSGDVGQGHDIALIDVQPAQDHPHIIEMANMEEYDQLTRCDFFNVFGTGTTNTGEGTSDQLLKTGDLQFLSYDNMAFFPHYQNGVLQCVLKIWSSCLNLDIFRCFHRIDELFPSV